MLFNCANIITLINLGLHMPYEHCCIGLQPMYHTDKLPVQLLRTFDTLIYMNIFILQNHISSKN